MISCHLVHLLSWMNKRWDDLAPFLWQLFLWQLFFCGNFLSHYSNSLPPKGARLHFSCCSLFKGPLPPPSIGSPRFLLA